MNKHQLFDSTPNYFIQDQQHEFLSPLENQMDSIQNIFQTNINHPVDDQLKSDNQPIKTQNTILPQLTKKLSSPTKKRIRKYTSNNPNNKKGHWSNDENIKYHWFLQLNADKFIQSQRRKVQKTFKSMSLFIQTRQAHQCRSHHQKMQKKLGTFPKILLHLRKNHYGSSKLDVLKMNMKKAEQECQNLIQSELLQNEQKLYLIYCKKSSKEVSSQSINQSYQRQDFQDGDNESSLFSLDKKVSSQNKLFLSDQYEDHLQKDIK